MQHNHERVGFGSKIGAILAAAGSAVGLGNIWRFPFETGNHGGAAFILIYLGCVFIFGLPIMIAEFTIGRRSKASTGGAYQALTRNEMEVGRLFGRTHRISYSGLLLGGSDGHLSMSGRQRPEVSPERVPRNLLPCSRSSHRIPCVLCCGSSSLCC